MLLALASLVWAQDLGYRDGYQAGVNDADNTATYGAHGLAGFGAGLVAAPCGCVLAPAVEAMILPGVPQGQWQAENAEYQKGYVDGYQRTVRNRRIAYAFAGSMVGSAVGVGIGLALGAASL